MSVWQRIRFLQDKTLLLWVNGIRRFEGTQGIYFKSSRGNYFGHFISCRDISNAHLLRPGPLLSSYIKDVNGDVHGGSKELFSLTGQRLLFSVFFLLSVTFPCIFYLLGIVNVTLTEYEKLSPCEEQAASCHMAHLFLSDICMLGNRLTQNKGYCIPDIMPSRFHSPHL